MAAVIRCSSGHGPPFLYLFITEIFAGNAPGEREYVAPVMSQNSIHRLSRLRCKRYGRLKAVVHRRGYRECGKFQHQPAKEARMLCLASPI